MLSIVYDDLFSKEPLHQSLQPELKPDPPAICHSPQRLDEFLSVRKLLRCEAFLQNFILEFLRVAILRDHPRLQRLAGNLMFLSQDKTLIHNGAHALRGEGPGCIDDHFFFGQLQDQIIVYIHKAALRLFQ